MQTASKEKAERKLIHHHDPDEIKTTGIFYLNEHTILVKEAFCHKGHNLMDNERTIKDKPSIKIMITHNNKDYELFLSPFMNDPMKISIQELPLNIITEVCCPVCKEELIKLSPCSCNKGAAFRAIFLTPNADHENLIGICDCHGCYRSFLKDGGKIISEVRVERA